MAVCLHHASCVYVYVFVQLLVSLLILTSCEWCRLLDTEHTVDMWTALSECMLTCLFLGRYLLIHVHVHLGLCTFFKNFLIDLSFCLILQALSMPLYFLHTDCIFVLSGCIVGCLIYVLTSCPDDFLNWLQKSQLGVWLEWERRRLAGKGQNRRRET